MGNPSMYGRQSGLEVWTDDESKRISPKYSIRESGAIYRRDPLTLSYDPTTQFTFVFGSVMNGCGTVVGLDGKNFMEFAKQSEKVEINDLNFVQQFSNWFGMGWLRMETYNDKENNRRSVAFPEEKLIKRMYRIKVEPTNGNKKKPVTFVINGRTYRR